MRYTFPEITEFEPIRQVVLNTPGLVITRHADYTVFNYTYVANETFPPVDSWENAIRRECRGLAFDLEGRLISRPLHKFFNAGERPETALATLDLNAPHVILEKLDGSMIRAIPLGNGYRLGTRSGVSLVSPQPEAFIASKPPYDAFIRATLARNETAVFEWCSRQQRIVLDHPEDRLVLIAVRENTTGRYRPMSDVRAEIDAESRFHGVDIVREFPGIAASMTALVDNTRGLTDNEGYVVRFDDGHMVKLKADWYVTRHRALEGMTREKVVLETLLAGAADDVKPLLNPEIRARFETFEQQFGAAITAETTRLEAMYADMRAQYGDDRKAFSLGAGKDMEQTIRSMMFAGWSGKDIRTELIAYLDKNTASGPRIDHARWAFGGLRWIENVEVKE